MIRLDALSVSGFKNIQDAKLKINDFNIVVGPNNSGKSNLLQVLSFINYIVNSSTDTLESGFAIGVVGAAFGEIVPAARRSRKAMPDSCHFEIEFSNAEKKKVYFYELEIGFAEVSEFQFQFFISAENFYYREDGKTGPKIRLFERNTKNRNATSKVLYGTKSKGTKALEDIPNHISVLNVLKLLFFNDEIYDDAIESLNKIVKSPTFYFSQLSLQDSEPKFKRHNGRTVSYDVLSEIIGLEYSDKWPLLIDACESILGIEDIEILTIGDEEEDEKMDKWVFFRHHGIIKNLNEFSDGTILMIALIVKTISSNDPILLIEEPENSTHPKALMNLVSFLRSYTSDKQFILTSHSLPLINGSKLDEIIVGEVQESGLSKFDNVNEKTELVKKLKHGYVSFGDEIFFNEGENEYEDFE